MFEFIINVVETIRRPFSTPRSRLQATRLRTTRAATFIEYAILALIVIAIGTVIYTLLTGSIEGVFQNVSNWLSGH